MRKLFCLIVLSILATSSIFAQAKKFDKKFGFFEYELTPSIQIVDSQNNHIVVGQFKGYHQIGTTTIQTRGDFDIFMIKYDANNAIVWVKTFGSSAEDNVVSLSCDKIGNIYFTGFYSGNAFYNSATDSLTIITGYAQSRYVTKLNTNGNPVWSKRFSASTSSGGDATKSEVINDHEGRVYLVHTTRANGTLSSWQFQDSVIANPTFNYINVPRWLLTRLDQNTGNIKWLDYIANPLISASNISIPNISRPIIDKNNHLVFSISHFGNHINPIYVFGQYAAVNSNINNILVRIDSVGTVRNFRDLGTATNSLSDIAEIALTRNNEVVLINKKAKATDNGITYDYTSNTNTFNYARIYDENFALVKIVKLGQQLIKSYVYDKQNRLITLGTSNSANFNQSPVDEVLNVDSSSKTVTFNTAGAILPYYFRYNESYRLDTFYLENRVNPLISFGVSPFALRLANNGDIIPSVGYPVMNMTMFRYDSTFKSKNALIGKHRDREDLILGIVEDKEGQLYTTGVIHGLANFNSVRNISDSIKIPFELGQDNFIAKYNKEGNIVWIKKIATPANDIISQMTISKTGIYFVVGNGTYTSWTFNDSLTITGRNVLIKVDFNGNLLWSKEVYTTVNPDNNATRPSFNLIKTLNNDNVIIGVYAYSTVNIGTTVVAGLGNRTGQIYAILNGRNGDIIRYNRFALRSESFSTMGNPIQNAHEDKNGNLYFVLVSNVTNVNAVNRANELYSLKTNATSFTHNYQTQPGMLKLDSTLEISKFNQFTSYMFISDINGQNDHIYISGRTRGSSFTYNNAVIQTYNYAQNPDFISIFARLDTSLNITKVTKFDTTTIESQFNLSSRKILIDLKTKNVYETLQFNGKTGLENVSYKTTSFGGTDLMFIKHDSTGSIIGAQHLGTPQTDSYSAGLINQAGSLVFTSRTVDPNYKSVILSPNLTSISSVSEIPIQVSISNNRQSYSTKIESTKKASAANEIVINKEILSPDTYLSKYISLDELGKNPDTTIVSISKITFCQGDSALIEVNDASSIKWKRGQQILSTEGNKLSIKTSGAYRAIIKTIEGFEDSTRVINIEVTPTPTAPLVENIAYCIGTSARTLTATASNDNNLLWYGTAATAGVATSTAMIPSASTVGQFDYYVSQKTIANACEGPRARISVTINSKPVAPVVNNIAYCLGVTANTLTATAIAGNSLKWYDTETSNTTLTTIPIPNTGAVGSLEYFVSQINDGTGCEGPRSKITAIINAKPAAPVVNNLAYCEGATANSLTATAITGNTLKWYLNDTTTSALSAIPIPNTKNPGSIEYFVSQKNDSTGCEGPRSKIITTINSKPAAPVVDNLVYCEGATAKSLTATAISGNTLKWYLTDTTLIALNSIPVPSTNKFGIQNYFVSQVNSTTSCESEKSKIVITINATPAKPLVSNVSYCIGATSRPVSAQVLDGNTLNWYLSDTTGAKLNAAPTPDTKTVNEQIYFVSQKNNITGCEGSRSKIIANTYPIPNKPLINRLDSNRLTSNVIGSIWYLDTLLLSDTSTIIKPKTSGRYFVKTNQNGCISSLSEQYYFLITDLYNLNAEEFIKFNPNPFNGQIKFDYLLKGISLINIELIQFSTGLKIFTKSNIKTGAVINLPNISSGVYLLSVSSPDGKFFKQFKAVRL